MAFQTPITIKEAIDHIHNNRFLLPAFRREFIWRPHQIERLFDSLMRGYPLGSFLFWRVDPETAKNHSFCQFITNYNQRKPHNPIHGTPSTVPGLKAVLDGQQRLTALNIGLRGRGLARKLPHRWWNNPRVFPEPRLYLNLLAPRMENEEGLSYKFSFLSEKEAQNRNCRNDQEHWYRVGDILDIEVAEDLIDFVHDLQLAGTKGPQKILYRLHRVVHNDGIILAYEEANQDPERVLNIFVRTNSGGTPLSYSDMLLSTAVVQWDKVDARKEIHSLVDEINNIGRGFSFNRDFVLKACLMLGDSNSVRFKVENFGKPQIGTLQDQWDRIRSTITETVELASSFGYFGQSLASADALLPIAYFLHHCQPALDTKDRKAIRDWLIRSLLKRGIWSSGVDNLLVVIRRAIRESSCHEGFPAGALEKAMPSGKSLTFDDEELQDLADAEYGGRAYSLLFLLYDFVDVTTNHFHIDHVFPRALMTPARLKQAGISEEQIPEYLARVNRLANLQLLEGSTNTSKGAKLPADWLSARYPDEEERRHHCHLHDLGEVPTEIEGFLDFYEARRSRILEKLRHLLASDSPGTRGHRHRKQDMRDAPTITAVQLSRYRIPFPNVGRDHGFAMGHFYEPGSTGHRMVLGVRIHTDIGVTGEYMSIAPATFEQALMFVEYLIGKPALQRERFYGQAKSLLRKNDRMGMGPIDIALWDLAGKFHDAPVYQLLGGYRERLPCYASTYHADRQPDGLSSPEAFADFAEQCLELGYKGFKIHPWGDPDIDREIATVKAVGRRVGGRMALMLDPCCVYDTFADTLAVGRACDEEGFYWYEDPMRDGGVSLHAHRKLRTMIKTPLLQGEHIHLVEAHADMAAADATDFWRADPEYDGGITGVMKIAHAAEGYGMDVELHIAGPAQRHCMAAMRNSNFYEMGLVHPKLTNIACPPVYACNYEDELETIDADGCVPVPQGPGLGVTYDWTGVQQWLVHEELIDTAA